MAKYRRYRVIRRQKLPNPARNRMRTQFRYRCDTVELDVRRRVAWCVGRAVRLTRREAALLAMFLASPGRAFTRGELLAGAWGAKGTLRTRTVDMHVRLLRKKLGEYQRITTVYKHGYRWDGSSAKEGFSTAGRAGAARR